MCPDSSLRARHAAGRGPFDTSGRVRIGLLAATLLSVLLPAAPLTGQVGSAGDESGNPLDEPLLPSPRDTTPRAAAPVDAPAIQAPDPDDPLDGETRIRLLKLRGGAVMRGSSRKVDGHWEIEQDDGWLQFPQGVVQSARLEHRVLREMRDRRDAVRRDDTEGLLDLARWEFSEGLHEEGLGIVDRVLEEDPDHVGALLLLAEPGFPFGLPRVSADAAETRRDLLDYAGQAPRSVQELIIRRLSQDEDPAALKEELAVRLSSASARERAFSALAGRRVFPEGIALKELLRRSVLDPYPEVRESAALALRDTGEEGLVLPLVRALESSSSMVRTHAARSLGTMGFAAAVEPLAVRLATLRTSSGGDAWRAPAGNIFVGRQVSFVQDFDTEIANSAVIAAPVIGIAQEGATLDVRVHGVSGGGGGGGLTYSYTTETKALRRALAKITDADVRDTNTAWREWWDTYGRDWVAKNLPDRPVESGTLVGGAGKR
jgi:hypothetical protein